MSTIRSVYDAANQILIETDMDKNQVKLLTKIANNQDVIIDLLAKLVENTEKKKVTKNG